MVAEAVDAAEGDRVGGKEVLVDRVAPLFREGSPLSPVLSNLYLDLLDRHIETWRGTRWVRYCDDFILMCQTRKAAIKARRALGRELKAHGLELHYLKTRVTSLSDGFIFLGVAFRGESLAAVPRKAARKRRRAA